MTKQNTKLLTKEQEKQLEHTVDYLLDREAFDLDLRKSILIDDVNEILMEHLCKTSGKVQSKSEENVMTTEQNTKPFKTYKEAKNLGDLEDWEEEFHAAFGGEKFFPFTKPDTVRRVIRSLLASQRHQLKEQVLEALGEPQPEIDNEEDYIWEQIRNDLRQRIEAVFEKVS